MGKKIILSALFFIFLQEFIYCSEELSKKDFSFGSISYMSERKAVEKVLGQSIGKDDISVYYIYKDETKVLYRDDKAVSIRVNSPKYKTSRGIKVGDSKEKIISLYGEASDIDPIFLIYQLKVSENQDENLRIIFYVRSGVVEFIMITDQKANLYFN